MLEPKFLIYGLIDPRNGELRYVGKSTSGMRRPRAHMSLLKYETNTYKANWLRQLLVEDFKPDIEVLETYESADALVEAERFLIAYFRSIGCRLTNLTAGGDGASGYKHTLEGRARISKALQGHATSDKVRESVAEANSKRILSDETRKKLSQRYLGIRISDEVRHRMSIAQQNQSIDSRIRRSRAMGCRPFQDQNGVVYQTQREAARALGLHAQSISQVLKGMRKRAGNFIFTYIPEVSNGIY